jgi:hypothetical protein
MHYSNASRFTGHFCYYSHTQSVCKRKQTKNLQYLWVYLCIEPSEDRSVGIATNYSLDSQGIEVQLLTGEIEFVLLRNVQTVSVAHPTSCGMDTRGSFTESKVTGPWSDTKNAWSYTFMPPYIFMTSPSSNRYYRKEQHCNCMLWCLIN